MKKIDLYFDNPPSSIKEKLFVDKLKDLLEKKKKGENVEIEGYAPSDVKKELIKIFNNKCAFCESDISTGHHYDTEHFRPKNKYYWLAYEWSNFLLACRKCNSDCKGEQFPIEGDAAMLPNIDFEKNRDAFLTACHIQNLENEVRLLMHPALDEPAEHLEFAKNGRVVAKNNSVKGQNSIEVYGLDDWETKKGKKGKRQDLIRGRLEIIEQVEVEVEHAILHFETEYRLYQDILHIHIKLIRAIHGEDMRGNKLPKNLPFSAVRKACLTNFKTFFIEGNALFTVSQKEILNKVYGTLLKNRTE